MQYSEDFFYTLMDELVFKLISSKTANEINKGISLLVFPDFSISFDILLKWAPIKENVYSSLGPYQYSRCKCIKQVYFVRGKMAKCVLAQNAWLKYVPSKCSFSLENVFYLYVIANFCWLLNFEHLCFWDICDRLLIDPSSKKEFWTQLQLVLAVIFFETVVYAIFHGFITCLGMLEVCVFVCLLFC